MFCGRNGAPIESKALSGGPQQRRVARRVGCGKCEQGLSVRWQFTQTLRKGRFKPARERNTGSIRKSLDQFRRGPRTRQFKERERITTCFRDDPIPNERIRWATHDQVKKPASVLSIQAAEPEFWQPRKFILITDIASSNKNHYPLGEQSPADKRNRLHRGPVDPLSIIDKPNDRLLLRYGRHQLQGGDTYQKSFRRGALGEAEHLIQNVPVQRREFCVVPGEWPANLLQAGVRELHLGLDASRTAEAEVLGVLREITQQSRLPNAGLSSKHQNTSLALSSLVKERGEPSLFLTPAQQLMAAAVEPEGTLSRRGMLDMTASHGGRTPPTDSGRIRVARLTLHSRSKRGMCEPMQHLPSQHISPLITRFLQEQERSLDGGTVGRHLLGTVAGRW